MRNPYYRGPKTDHFDGTRFTNLHGPTQDRSLHDIWRWKRAARPAPWPQPVSTVAADRPPACSERLRVSMVGHATLLIQVAGLNILIDPVWSDRASPLSFAGPRRHAPPGIAFADLPKVDAVLVTHSHYDHMDLPTLRRLWARDRPLVIAPLGNDAVIRRTAARIEVQTGDWWDRFELAGDVRVTLCPANHWSSRSLSDRRCALWCGFVLHTPKGVIYLAGDTGWGDGTLFAQVRTRCGRPLLAVLPIGAYEPRWFMAAQHMNPAEAVQALHACGADFGLGVHWGTFQLTDEAQDAPALALALARTADGVAPDRFRAMRAGETWQPPTAA